MLVNSPLSFPRSKIDRRTTTRPRKIVSPNESLIEIPPRIIPFVSRGDPSIVNREKKGDERVATRCARSKFSNDGNGRKKRLYPFGSITRDSFLETGVQTRCHGGDFANQADNRRRSRFVRFVFAWIWNPRVPSLVRLRASVRASSKGDVSVRGLVRRRNSASKAARVPFTQIQSALVVPLHV